MIELQEDILRFSSNWETYLEKCQKTNGGIKQMMKYINNSFMK